MLKMALVYAMPDCKSIYKCNGSIAFLKHQKIQTWKYMGKSYSWYKRTKDKTLNIWETF